MRRKKYTAIIYLNPEQEAILEKEAEITRRETGGDSFNLQDVLNVCLATGIDQETKKYTKKILG